MPNNPNKPNKNSANDQAAAGLAPAQSNRDALSFVRAYGLYGGAGFGLAVAVVLGVLAGRWLDEKLETSPWFLIVGVLLGTAAGFINLYRLLKFKIK